MAHELEIPEYLQDTYDMLVCAFPEGISQTDYIPLLAILHDYMSFRTIARVLPALTDKDYGEVFNDASGFKLGDPSYPCNESDLLRIGTRLKPCGFDNWVAKEGIHRVLTIAEDVSYAAFITGYYGRHTEWVNGTVLSLPDTALPELELRWWLTLFFDVYVELADGGRALSEPFVMRPGTNFPARAPDVMVLLPDRMQYLQDNQVAGPANLVVEIVSPESVKRDRGEKFEEYERGGALEYWLLDPMRKESLFYVLGEDGLFHSHSQLPVDGVYTSTVLPKLKLNVDIFWQEKLPTTRETVKLVERMLDIEK